MKSLKTFFVELRLNKVYRKNRSIKSAIYKQTLLSVKKVLIVYPATKENESNADDVLRILFNYFENSKFIIIKPNELNKKLINYIGLPKKVYFHEFSNDFPFDIIIDLNLKFNIMSTFIIGMMESKLNIRLFKHQECNHQAALLSAEKLSHSHICLLSIK